MNQFIANITIVVDDYDAAIEFYTKKLHFELVEDTRLSATKRWVRVRPPNNDTNNGCCLLLAQADGEEQRSRVGNQTGGRVFLFLYTDDFERDYQNLVRHDITIVRPQAVHEYGTVAVFRDLYGNQWDLIEPSRTVETNK
mmetsp:Transcript_14263/g.39624  ORF Transcript_14263/g.39624 Transcript_14263/m.39624 type:complete len:140 (+) Transcript_14263:76-495(+)